MSDELGAEAEEDVGAGAEPVSELEMAASSGSGSLGSASSVSSAPYTSGCARKQSCIVLVSMSALIRCPVLDLWDASSAVYRERT